MSDSIQATPPVLAGVIPPPLIGSHHQSGGWRKIIAVLLSVCLILFLADAVVSWVDDSLNLFLGIHPFTVLRLATTLIVLLLTFLIYILTRVKNFQFGSHHQ
jgi:hypothetical protein